MTIMPKDLDYERRRSVIRSYVGYLHATGILTQGMPVLAIKKALLDSDYDSQDIPSDIACKLNLTSPTTYRKAAQIIDAILRSEAGRNLASYRIGHEGLCRNPLCVHPIVCWGRRKYCNNRCRQAAYRERHNPNSPFVKT